MDVQEIDDEERAMLYLFMCDLRDHEIASRLFISVRTVQRRLDRLMTIADAQTRFGLGARATKLGWIDPDSPGGLTQTATARRPFY
ncbi:helix-turn-helix domain-containing protein [Hamadaea tsunoensis]|uniref:hypothetical protein n=1 Tax=Hamadaea tsunoensis TaxID=53368 RepID=UPI000406B82A|nr:hypothetical protein [Hamadaea tsunoensis]